MANFEKKLQMGQKHDQIKDHFFSSPLNIKSFSEKYFETYGYASASQLRKTMRTYNILMRERNKHIAENTPNGKI